MAVQLDLPLDPIFRAVASVEEIVGGCHLLGAHGTSYFVLTVVEEVVEKSKVEHQALLSAVRQRIEEVRGGWSEERRRKVLRL